MTVTVADRTGMPEIVIVRDGPPGTEAANASSLNTCGGAATAEGKIGIVMVSNQD